MKLKKNLVLAIILVISLVFMAGCSGKADVEVEKTENAVISDDVVAIVDGLGISKDKFDKSFTLIEKNYNDLYGDGIWSTEVEGKTVKQIVKNEILENLITEKLIVEYVKNTGFTPKEEDVDDSYSKFEDAIKDNEEIKNFYLSNGIDENFIKEEIKAQLYNNEFMRLISEDVKLSDEELKDMYSSYPVQVKAAHILVDSEDIANEVLDKLKNGGDFSELAKEYSKDPGSAENGGDLGYFPRGVMVAEFENVAFSTPAGEISDIVKSKFGYHIIKVEDIKTINDMVEDGASDAEIEAYKNSIEGNLVKEAYGKKIDELKSKANIEKNENIINE